MSDGYLSSADGRVLVSNFGFDLYDTDGRRLISDDRPLGSPDEFIDGAWLDSRHLLVDAPGGSGVMERWTIADGTRRILGTGPAGWRQCVSTSTRMVCLASAGLVTMKIG